MVPSWSAVRRTPLRAALALVAVPATVLAVLEVVLSGRANPEHAVLVGSFPVGCAASVLVGALAWSRRPHNRTGLLLCVTGLLILGAALADTALPAPVTSLGLLLGETPIAAALHVVLAFPS